MRGLSNIKIWQYKHCKVDDSKMLKICCDLYLTYIYEKIWKMRCQEVVSSEKSQSIGKLD
jgi:hypothetical protein